ncbi:MAG: hypothetical protein GXP45_02750 [bacterium]|nr:hypothetical protein [bacterium]
MIIALAFLLVIFLLLVLRASKVTWKNIHKKLKRLGLFSVSYERRYWKFVHVFDPPVLVEEKEIKRLVLLVGKDRIQVRYRFQVENGQGMQLNLCFSQEDCGGDTEECDFLEVFFRKIKRVKKNPADFFNEIFRLMYLC